MHSVRVDIGGRQRNGLAELMLDAKGRLHIDGSPHVWGNLVNGGCCNAVGCKQCRRGRILIEPRVLDHVLLLICSVVAESLQNIIFRKAIIEPAIAAANDGLAGCFSVSAGSPCEGKPRSHVGMIANTVLRFVADAITKRKVGAHFEVVLCIQAGVQVVHTDRRIANRHIVL